MKVFQEVKETAVVLVAQYLLACIVCICWGFFSTDADFLIEIYRFWYKIREGFLLFTQYLPAIQLSSLLIGYSWAFGRTAFHSVGRLAPVFMDYMRGSIILIILCIAVTTAMLEIAQPFLKHTQYTKRLNSSDYSEFMQDAEESFGKKELKTAFTFLMRALHIYPESEVALALFSRIERALAEEEGLLLFTTQSVDSSARVATETEITALEALSRARVAFEKADYFGAHYFAQLAEAASDNRDSNKSAARQLAGEAWDKLSEFSSKPYETNEYGLFSLKRDGYMALQSGDYVRAYYIFKRLAESTATPDGRVIDPDITYYLEIADAHVKEQHFFINETYSLRSFETVRKVSFSLHRPDGYTDIIAIEGLSYSSDMGQAVQYVRGLNVMRLSPDGSPFFRFSVPYAKMLEYTLKDDTSVIASLYPSAASSLGAHAESVPLLLLYGVDAVQEGVRTEPVYTIGEAPKDNPHILFLPMPYDDFSLLIENSYGIDAMSLMSLWDFSKKAASYGFASEIYLEALISRLLFPFLLLVLSLFATMFGWNYRITGKQAFKTTWALFVPVFVLVCYACIEVARYVLSLFLFMCIGYEPLLAFPASLVIIIVVLIVTLARFLTLRGE